MSDAGLSPLAVSSVIGRPKHYGDAKGTVAVPCPNCGEERSGVYNSRVCQGGRRRYRVCSACEHRFGTVEMLDTEQDAALLSLLKALEPQQRSVAETVIRALASLSPTTPPAEG